MRRMTSGSKETVDLRDNASIGSSTCSGNVAVRIMDPFRDVVLLENTSGSKSGSSISSGMVAARTIESLRVVDLLDSIGDSSEGPAD
jgi:hypothetical protein